MVIRPGLPLRNRVIADVGQCIVFSQYANHRLAFTPFGHECRWHVCHTALKPEAFALQDASEEFGRLEFSQCDFRVVPQLHGHGFNFRFQRSDLLDDRLLLAGKLKVGNNRLQRTEKQKENHRT